MSESEPAATPEARGLRREDALDHARRETEAFARLAGDALAGLTRAVQRGHRQVGDVVDRAVPESLRPWRPMSRVTTEGIYSAVAAGVRVAPAGAVALARATGREAVLSPSRHALARRAQAAVNGLWRPLAEAHPDLRIAMAVRVDHEDLTLDAASVAAAFPDATGRIAVFVHGLVLDEDCWRRSSVVDDPIESYGARLRRDHGITDVYLRYNTGESLQCNGEALSDVLDRLFAAWPVPLADVTLVGHSMGGLVAVAAIQDARRRGTEWQRRCDAVVTLGTPHHGAPLARLLRESGRLAAVPVVGPAAEWARVRSDGAADLCLDPHRDTSGSADSGMPPVTVISAARFGSQEHRLLQHVGDGLVPTYSADARRARAFDVIHRHVDAVGHLDLLNHPEVYRHLATAVAGSPEPAGAVGGD